MEYCAGGSVYKMLEDPVNMYGLLEDEFLVFLRDISTSSYPAVLAYMWWNITPYGSTSYTQIRSTKSSWIYTALWRLDIILVEETLTRGRTDHISSKELDKQPTSW